MRLFVLARHGESTLNVERVVNGDPARDVRLTERGPCRVASPRCAGAERAAGRLCPFQVRAHARDGRNRTGAAWGCASRLSHSSTTSMWATSRARRSRIAARGSGRTPATDRQRAVRRRASTLCGVPDGRRRTRRGARHRRRDAARAGRADRDLSHRAGRAGEHPEALGRATGGGEDRPTRRPAGGEDPRRRRRLRRKRCGRGSGTEEHATSRRRDRRRLRPPLLPSHGTTVVVVLRG